MENYHREFANLSGEKVSCTYVALTRRESMYVEYNVLGLMTTALANASAHVMALFNESKNDVENAAVMARAIASVYQAIPFEVFDDISRRILRGAILQRPDRSETIDDLHDTDFFDDRLDELLLATFYGLEVSFPRAFTRALALLKDLNERKGQGETTSKTSNGASTGNTLSSSQSLDSTG